MKKLEKWYNSRCDGEWEHSYGIEITTIDNPGWMVTIDLHGTPLESSHWIHKVENSDSDWMICQIVNKQFLGSGDIYSLEDIIHCFINLTSEQSAGDV